MRIVLGLLAGLLLAWLALVAALLAARPRGGALREALRLLPDLLRLVGRLAADRGLPPGVRLRLGGLAAYLALPFDLVPDFVPVLGYADDAILVAVTLRSVARRVGVGALRRHWPGSDEGFAALSRLCRLDRPARPGGTVGVDLALAAALAAYTAALAAGWGLGLDVAVYRWCDGHRALYPVATLLNYLGQGLPLTLLCALLAVLLGRRERSVRPLLPVLAAFVLTYLTIGPLKLLTHRAPPHNQNHVPEPERLFSDLASKSYPSGHVANSIVWYAVLALLLTALLRGRLPEPARWALRLAPPLVVFGTTTYLGFHWISDSVAGALLGLLLARVLGRVDWTRVPLPARLAARGWTGPAGLSARAARPSGVTASGPPA